MIDKFYVGKYPHEENTAMGTRAVDTAETRAHQTPPPLQRDSTRVDALPEEKGWHEETGPTFIKFEKPGDTLTGELVDVREIMMSGKTVKQYVFDLGNGLAKFNGTFSVMEKLGTHHIGKLVRVRYIGDDAVLGTQQNPMKLFQVQTKDKAKPNNPAITDADLPPELR